MWGDNRNIAQYCASRTLSGSQHTSCYHNAHQRWTYDNQSQQKHEMPEDSDQLVHQCRQCTLAYTIVYYLKQSKAWMRFFTFTCVYVIVKFFLFLFLLWKKQSTSNCKNFSPHNHFRLDIPWCMMLSMKRKIA